MHRNKSTGLWRIIGTVFGGGYLCGRGTIARMFGSTNGLWSSVSAQLDWVKEVVEEYSTVCRDEQDDQDLLNFLTKQYSTKATKDKRKQKRKRNKRKKRDDRST